MKQVLIGKRWVGDSQPVYVIAEAGSNHNGSYEMALRLIDVAAEAGADAVKFQNFKASLMYPQTAGESDYLKIEKPIHRIIQDMEMPDQWVPKLAAHCATRGVEFLSTPFDEQSADVLAPHVNAFKIASYEMTHAPLVAYVARYGKPVILSTGAAELSEVIRAVDVVRAEGNEQIILMQCTAKYPAPLESINASAIRTLREATGRPVGLSDHSRDPIVAPIVATALGACVVEKHFTLSNRLPGPDHAFAVEPDELKSLVRSIRAAQAALGHGRKEVLADERELYHFARRSIFTTRPVRSGEALGADNIAVLRCGKLEFGLEPAQYSALLGRIAAHDLPAEVAVRLTDLT